MYGEQFENVQTDIRLERVKEALNTDTIPDHFWNSIEVLTYMVRIQT